MALHITFDETNQSHVSWFSATVARTTVDPHAGAGCLSWTANDSFSGVETANSPGYVHGEAAGTLLRPRLWIKGKSGSYDTSIGWSLFWQDGSGALKGSNTNIQVPVTSEWTQFVTPTDIAVPVDSTHVIWQFDTNSAGAGSVILIDDIQIAPAEVVSENPFSLWEGGERVPITLLGVWDGSAVQPLTYRVHE